MGRDIIIFPHSRVRSNFFSYLSPFHQSVTVHPIRFRDSRFTFYSRCFLINGCRTEKVRIFGQHRAIKAGPSPVFSVQALWNRQWLKEVKKRGVENLFFSVRRSCFRHQGCPSSAEGLVQADQVGCNGAVTFGKLVLKGQ